MKYLPPFSLDNGFEFFGAYYDFNDKYSFLIQAQYGTSVVLSNELLNDIEQADPSEDLQFKLIQHGFGRIDGSNEIIDANDKILPAFFLIDLTKCCNLRCKYCFRDLRENEEIITDDTIDAICGYIFEYVKKHNINCFSVQPWGGEPLIRLDKIIRIRKFFEEKEACPEISIETNGTLLDDKTVKLLKENNIELGVSIDGTEVAHNAQRPYMQGGGSFEKVISGIRNLQNAGYEGLGTITVITKNNYDKIDEILDFFAKDLGLSSVKLNPLRKTDSNDYLGTEPEEIEEFTNSLLSKLAELNNSGYRIIDSNVANKIRNLIVRPDDNICNSKGCMGGKGLVSFDKNGRIYPCEMSDYPEECIGNIGSGTDLCENIKKAQKTHTFYKTKKADICDTCPWWYYCRGGCSSTVKFTSSEVCGIDAGECDVNRILYPKLVRLILDDEDTALRIAGLKG